jgi:AbiV family abortive infection protein
MAPPKAQLTADQFIDEKHQQFTHELARSKLRCFKDIGRHGEHCWLREAWTFQRQLNYAQKVHVLERFRLVELRGSRANDGGAKVGNVEYRIGYWTLGRIGRAKDRWVWGQYSLLIPAEDLLPLLRKAVADGTLRGEDIGDGLRPRGSRNRGELGLEVLAQLRAAAIENANRLLQDATHLYETGRYPSATVLAITAAEELAKWKALFVVSLEVAASEPVDWIAFWKRWGNHSAKLRVASDGDVIVSIIDEHPEWFEGEPLFEAWARKSGIRNANSLFDQRNAALYVDWERDSVQAPGRIIDQDASWGRWCSPRSLLTGRQRSRTSMVPNCQPSREITVSTGSGLSVGSEIDPTVRSEPVRLRCCRASRSTIA